MKKRLNFKKEIISDLSLNNINGGNQAPKETDLCNSIAICVIPISKDQTSCLKTCMSCETLNTCFSCTVC
ncbi:MAG: hypothetical protein ACEPOV_14210 [Hyphomicrobiales bacterium]